MEHLAEVPQWVRDFYAMVDVGDVEGSFAVFADDVEVQFGNHPVAAGGDAVARVLQAVHAPLAGSVHHFRNVWVDGATTMCEFVVDYTLKDGRVITIGSFTILERRHGRIAKMRVYLDQSAFAA